MKQSSVKTLNRDVLIKKLKVTTMLSCAAVLGAQGPAFAAPQEEEFSFQLDEIIVTSRRVKENLQRVPIAVTAFNEIILERRNILNITEISKSTPSLQISQGRGSSSSTVVYMRGVGQNDDFATADPGVGIYVDDVYVARSQGSLLKLNDIERIEVLRGPQGTLYGKNTIGGAIKVVSKKPSNEFTYDADLTYGSFNQLDGRLAVNLPLVEEKLAVRFSGATFNRDGYVKNTFTGNKLNDANVLAGRVQLRYQPDDRIDLTLSVDGTRDRSNANVSNIVAFNEDASFKVFSDMLLASDGFGSYSSFLVPDGGDIWTVQSDAQEGARLDVWGVNLHAEFSFDAVTVKSITSYRSTVQAIEFDVDNVPANLLHSFSDMEQSQFSQELQFSGTNFDDKLDWLFGLYYFDEDNAGTSSVELFPGLRGTVFPLDHPMSNLSFIRDFKTKTKSYAAFFQGIVHLNEKLSATLGGRYTNENKKVSLAVLNLFTGAATFDSEGFSTKTFENFAPKLGLDYQVTEDVMVYASASRGFKSGGFNGRGGIAGKLQPYNPEKVWSFESGMKSRWYDGKLQLNAAAFYMDYTDIQLSLLTALEGNQLVQAIRNAGKAHTYGLELELTARPVNNLDIFGSLGLMDANYDEYKDDAGTDFSDREFQDTPKLTFSAGVNYLVPLQGRGSLTFGVDYAYQGKTYLELTNSPALVQQNYGLLGARIAYETEDGRYQVSLIGKNLTDSQYMTTGVTLANPFGQEMAWFGVPRTLSVQFKIRH